MDTETKKRIKKDPAINELDEKATNPMLAEQRELLVEENDIIGQLWDT